MSTCVTFVAAAVVVFLGRENICMQYSIVCQLRGILCESDPKLLRSEAKPQRNCLVS